MVDAFREPLTEQECVCRTSSSAFSTCSMTYIHLVAFVMLRCLHEVKQTPDKPFAHEKFFIAQEVPFPQAGHRINTIECKAFQNAGSAI